MINYDNIPSVFQLNEYIKTRFENDENLQSILVQGEISNFKLASNGVYYFSLNDLTNNASISCVLFKNSYVKLGFTPNNGDKVIIYGSINIYSGKCNVSLKAYNIIKQGIGSKLLQFEQLKEKLFKEGLFDESKKRKINIFPKTIGVISALNSAALKDILVNIKRRYPFCDIYVFPCQVQGQNASQDILKAFLKSQEYQLDTLIIGRGGGSSEDLSAFNDETLIRAIANRNCPIISAVGHEIDLTLIDYIADKRASTPTGAAELATADKREIKQLLENYDKQIKTKIISKLNAYINEFNYLKQNISSIIKGRIEKINLQIENYEKRLNDLHPYNILKRGYSVTFVDNKVVKDIKQIKVGNIITTKLKNGTIISEIKEVKDDEN